ncbi:Oidioi.mRNA.OKI2018_I69.chr2.g5844.t1.cds [Oikopleura dioica]|uniref:Haloacid dehalogenase-like hydrolase domain-containing protein 3 n=1 Tax=Oikopleura dioica TaxID=34765 RepID=A0ABN7T243_OIKDI|nr:Oidioi.mRNA.OKI2018_I69.chr2.g5844.t1.cds [Oikopleura dioica]
MAFRLVSFDALDTLIRISGSVGQQYLRTLDLHTINTISSVTEEAVNRQFSYARKEIMKKHPAYGFYTQKTSEEIWRQLETTEEELEEAFQYIYHAYDYELIENATDLLESIDRSKTKTCIYSNGDERLHKHLQQLGIYHHFDFVLTSAETGLEKPRAQAYIRCLEVAGIKEPSEAVHIGDDVEKDFHGPRRVGMHSINILPNKPASVPDDSHVKDLDALKNVLSQFDLTRMLVQLKSNPWLRVPIATLQFLWVALNNITGVFGYWCLHICALPIKCVDKQLFDTIERNLYHITFFFCSSWGFENGWKMIVSGDYEKLEELVNEKCILVANHQNTCDISALMWPLVTLKGLQGAVTWIMDAIFKLSSFGWVCLGHDDFFIWQQADAKQFRFAAPCDPENIKEHELAVSCFIS